MFLWVVVTLATLPNWTLDEQSWMNRLQRSVSAFLWTVNMGLDLCVLFHFFRIKNLAKFNTNKLVELVEFFGTRKIEISKNFPSSLSQKIQIFSRKKKTLGWTRNRQAPTPKLRCSLPNSVDGASIWALPWPDFSLVAWKFYFGPGLLVLPKNTLPYWLPIQTPPPLSLSLSLQRNGLCS